MATEHTDVLIVGAGPTGLTLALALARAGIDHMLIDKQAEGANTSRAAVIHARTLEVLEPLGVSRTLCERGMMVHRFRVHEDRRELLQFSFDGLPTAYSFLLMLPQDQTEAVLLAHLQAAGGEVRRPAEFVEAQIQADGVTATVTQAGQAAEIRARYLVACDGGRSRVRDSSGLGFTGGDYPDNFILADVALDGAFDRLAVQGYLSGDGLMIIAPLPGEHFRVVATVDEAPEVPELALLQSVLDARAGGGLQASDLAWSSRFRLQHRLADTFRSGPVLLAGDAAHVHSPAGGQGMNIGVRDAAELAVALTSALGGEDEAVLDRWAARRRKIAAGVVDLTDRATRIASARSPLVRTLRDAGLVTVNHLPPVQRALAHRLTGLDERPTVRLNDAGLS